MMSYPDFYDDTDFYGEPNEFDRQVDEFKESLMRGVKAEFLEEMESLRKENAELQDVKKNFESIKSDYKRKENEFNRLESDIESRVRREHWLKLLKDQEVTLYKADYSFDQGEKCDKCDSNRYIHYTSPQGNPAKEKCNCAKNKIVWKPKLVIRYEFKVKSGEVKAWYKESHYYDGVLCIDEDSSGVFARQVVTESLENYSDIDRQGTFFEHENHCQEYCDYLQELEDKKQAE